MNELKVFDGSYKKCENLKNLDGQAQCDMASAKLSQTTK